jgi:hypothetical protein
MSATDGRFLPDLDLSMQQAATVRLTPNGPCVGAQHKCGTECRLRMNSVVPQTFNAVAALGLQEGSSPQTVFILFSRRLHNSRSVGSPKLRQRTEHATTLTLPSQTLAPSQLNS